MLPTGSYVYIETSAPRRRGDKAILLSQMLPAVSGHTQRCLTFWYSMHGTSMGTLNVGMKLANGQLVTVWTLSGDQGSVWRYGRVPLNKPGVYYKVSCLPLPFGQKLIKIDFADFTRKITLLQHPGNTVRQ